MKRKTVWIFVVIMFIGGVCMVMPENRNVFDEMYNTWAHSDFAITCFKNVPSFSKNRIEGYTYPGGSMTNELVLIYDCDFKDEQTAYLKKNTHVSMHIFPDSKDIEWVCSIDYDVLPGEKFTADEAFYILYDYDVRSKTLTIQPMKATSRSLAEKYPDRFTRYVFFTDTDDIHEFMTLHGISNEDLVSYKEYFLNDVIIGLWITGNGNASHYKLTDVGDYILVDNSNIPN